MRLNDFQKDAMRTAKIEGFKFNLGHAALGLCGEAGEFSDCVKKYLVYNKPFDKENAVEELGDLLWFIALACEAIDVPMVDVALKNIEKLKARYPEKYSDEHAAERLDKM